MSDDARSDAESHFLSYSRADQEFALRLATDLRAEGISIFVDQWDIRPSEHWDRAIERAVDRCRGLVVIVSPRSIASDNVMDEISFAIEKRKSVLPVMIEKCVLPLRITRMHVIDGTGSYDMALQQCLAELGRTPVPERPISPSARAARRPPLDPQIIADAKRGLTDILGPIAKILVDKAALEANSPEELYSLLLARIQSADDRERFMNGAAPITRTDAAPRPSAGNNITEEWVIAADELDAIAAELTRYIGPIAPIVARRESRASTSLTELRQRLAAFIPTDIDRAEFLRSVAT